MFNPQLKNETMFYIQSAFPTYYYHYFLRYNKQKI